MPREGELILSDFSLKLCLTTKGGCCFVFLASGDDAGRGGGSGGVNGWTGPLSMFAGELVD